VPVRITNRSRGLLTLQLNSGESLYLAPTETSGSLEDLEVTANRWVQRLVDRDLIAVHEMATQPTPPGAQAAGRRKRGSQT
jgi:hypothetical protein